MHRNLAPALRTFLGALADFVFPPYCAICSGPLAEGEQIVCERCWSQLEVLRGPYCCPRCGLPLEEDADGCPECSGKTFNFSGAKILAEFGPISQGIIHLLKYAGKRSLGHRLGELLADVVSGDDRSARADLIVPVPLHPSRLRERGYNQSALIARSMGRCMGTPVDERGLRRIRQTRTQTALTSEERRRNVAGAFEVRSPGRITGRRVLLVDDVLTTGATVDACAVALLDEGASEVFVAAVARPTASK